MSFLSTFARLLREYMAFVTFSAMILGLLVGEPAAKLAWAVPWFFSVLTFNSGLGLRIQDLRCLQSKPWIIPFHLLWLHAITPLIALGVSSLFPFPPEAIMGFVILAIIPVSASCVVWIAMYRGNIALGMALVFIDTLFAPFLIPYALDFLFGSTVHMDPLRMLRGLFWMLLFPTLLALFLNRLTDGKLQRVAGKPVATLAQCSIFMILFINGGIVAPLFRNLDILFVAIFAMAFAFLCLWFVLNYLLGRLLLGNDADTISFMLNSTIRSTTTGMVIAMTYFSPLTTLTVVSMMLVQQPMASFIGKRLSRKFANREHAEDSCRT